LIDSGKIQPKNLQAAQQLEEQVDRHQLKTRVGVRVSSESVQETLSCYRYFRSPFCRSASLAHQACRCVSQSRCRNAA
jgi:hypothetical protein